MKMAKRVKRTVLVGLIGSGLLLGIGAGFSGCMSFTLSEEELRGKFAAAEQPMPELMEIEDYEGVIALAKAGMGTEATVVLVHGSPGSWDNFSHILMREELTRKYTLLAVDRPGFGRSLPKGPERSIEEQARRIHNAVAASGVKLPAVWLGHSLGGPVVARIAVDYPESVSGLVLVAPSIDPDLEKRKWFNWAAKFPLVKWGLSREWRNSNEEIFPLRGELEVLAKRLGEIQAPTVVVQGDKDSLVPPENAAYVKERFSGAKVTVRMLEGVDHFIPWSNEREMMEAVVGIVRSEE